MSTQEKFEQAAKDVFQLSTKPDNATLLKLYGLYKQATVGDNEEEPPANPFDFAARFKHEEWKKLAGTSKEDAMNNYINLVNELVAS